MQTPTIYKRSDYSTGFEKSGFEAFKLKDHNVIIIHNEKRIKECTCEVLESHIDEMWDKMITKFGLLNGLIGEVENRSDMEQYRDKFDAILIKAPNDNSKTNSYPLYLLAYLNKHGIYNPTSDQFEPLTAKSTIDRNDYLIVFPEGIDKKSVITNYTSDLIVIEWKDKQEVPIRSDNIPVETKEIPTVY